METSNGKLKWFRQEVQFIVWIATFVAAILFNYLTTQATIKLNTYRINQLENRVESVEKARIEAWTEQRKVNESQTAALNNILIEVVGIRKDIRNQ